MSKKNKIILISIVAAAIIIVAILIWENANKREIEHETTRIEEEGAEGGAGRMKHESGIMNGEEVKEEKEVKILSPEEIEEENLKSMAANFVERWWSWSTDGGYENFESLKVQMTDEMKEFTDVEVASKKQQNKKTIKQGEIGNFYGITTKALSVSVNDKTESAAVLTVICQKSINENGTASVAYDEVELEMVKEEGWWMVSRIP